MMATTTLRTSRLLPLLGLLAIGGCGGGGDAAAEEETGPQPFQILEADLATAVRSEIADQVVLTGSLDPYRVVNLTAQVPGTLVRLYVDRGVAVRAGQPLAEIEAEGIRGMADAAESQLEVARRSLEGARTLHEAGAMSDLDYESAEAAYQSARAAAASASESARRATLTSPLNGTVSARWASAGEPVNPGQPVLTVVDTRILELRGQLPVEEAIRVRPGQVVRFEVNGYPGQVFEGTVDRVEPTADATTRQVGVYARLDNPGGRMPGGLFARGRIAVDRLEDVVLVPRSALRTQTDGMVVYVLEDGVIHHRAVQPGPSDPVTDRVAILSGLEAGERVVITPTVEVPEGTTAEVTASPGAAVADTTAEG